MRLIDAETLEEQGWIMQRTVRVDASTMEWQQRKPTDFPAEPYVPMTSYDSLDDTCKRLRKALAYAVPVVHGEWIEVDDAIITGTCSVCGWNAIFAETDVTGMPYCPHCGAKMDGERKDDE